MMFNRKILLLALVLICVAGILMSAGDSTNSPRTYAWSSPVGMASARSNACSVALSDGRVLITGGVGADGPLSSAETYGLDGQFKAAASMMEARSAQGCAVLPDGTVLVAGGWTSGGGVSNSVEIYNPQEDTWTAGPPMLTPRAGATVSVLNDKRILVAGGESASGASNTLEIYDPKLKQFSAVDEVLTSVRTGHAAAVLANGQVLIAGGTDGVKALDTLDIFDPTTNRVTAAGRMTVARLGLTATTLLHGEVLLLGGTDGVNELGVAELFNPSTGTSRIESAVMQTPRQGHVAVRVEDNNGVLIVGGVSNGTMPATAELYIPWMHKFQPAGTISSGRVGAVASTFARLGKALIAGGKSATSSVLGTAETIDLPTIMTDKDDYSPGQPVIFSGANWAPNGTVTVTMTERYDGALTGDNIDPIVLKTDASGKIVDDGEHFAPDINDLGVTFYVTATQQTGTVTLTAQTSFTDAANVKFTNGSGGTCATGSTQYQKATEAAPFGQPICADASGLGNGINSVYLVWINPGGEVYSETVSGSNGTFSHIRTPNAGGRWTMSIYNQQGGSLLGGGYFWVAQGGKLAFTTAAATALKDQCSSNFQVQQQTTDGTPISTFSFPTTAALTTSAGSGTFYSDSTCTTVITSTSIPAGDSYTPNFYYKDTAEGSRTLTATAVGMTPATTTISIGGLVTVLTVPAASATYGSPATLSATLTAGGNPVAGQTIQFTLAGNLAGSATTDAAGLATLSAPSGIPGTYTLDAAFAGSGAYRPSNGTGSLVVSAKAVTASVTAASKTYDRSAAATITNCTVNGLVGSDVVTCSVGAASFADANVGTGKTVTATGITLGGAAAAYYTLSPATATTTADITALTVTASVTAASKTYDRSAAATLTGCTLAGVLAGDDVTCSAASATFADPNVGDGKTVTASGITLGGAQAGNYILSSTTATTTANITPVTVTASVTAASKTYDRTTAATLTGCTLAGVLAGDEVTCSAASAAFDNANVGNGKTVTASGISLGGAQAGNYVLSSTTATTTANITAVTVTASVTASSKPYDGTASATLTGCTLAGVLAGDDVTCSAASAVFDNANAGDGKTVTASGLTLGGAQAGNYVLASTTATTTANITAKPVTASVTADSKNYDGTTAATISSCVVNGKVGSDDVTCSAGSASFADANAGTGKTVTATGITLGGAAAPNYALSPNTATTTADISQKAATVTPKAASKTYGDTDPTFEGTLTGFLPADNVTATYSRTAGETVGGSPYTISATLSPEQALGNYQITYNTAEFTITAKAASVTPNASSKTYGDADPTFTGTLSGFVAADGITATYTRTAGEAVAGSPYAISATLSPAEKLANYQITYNTANFTINAKSLTVTAAAKSKVYGEADPALTYQLTGSLAEGDSLTGALTRVAGENVGTHAIEQGTLTAGANYALTFVGANLNITARPISVTADAKTKLSGESDPPLTYQLTSGSLVAGDAFSGALSRAPGEDAGTYAIQRGTLTAGANYTLSFVGANLVIRQSIVTITVAADPKTKMYGDPDPAFTYRVTSGALEQGDLFTGELSRAPGKNIGTYAIQQGTLSLPSHYKIVFVSADLTITKRQASVAPYVLGKPYGTQDPQLTGVLQGFIPEDNIRATYVRTPGENLGSYIVSATLSPAELLGNYNITYHTAEFTIGRADTNITIVGTPAVIMYGTPMTFTITLTGAAPSGTIPPGGIVTLYDGATLLGTAQVTNGVAIFTVSNLTPGTHDICATYSGYEDYGLGGKSYNAVFQAIVQSPTTVRAAATPDVSGATPQLTLSATVGGATSGGGFPTGQVQFVDAKTNEVIGTAPLNQGVATLSMTPQKLSSREVKAIYAGDGNYIAGNSAPTSQIAIVNAADFVTTRTVPDAIMSIFGSSMAAETPEGASLPLPTTLAGAKVTVLDSAGVQREAQLFYASQGQINLAIPAGTAAGKTTVTVTNPNGDAFSIITMTTDVAPGIFTANSSGTGVAAGQISRVNASGQATVEPVAGYDETNKNIVPLPIEFRDDSLYLVLYGTGLRNAQGARLVEATVGGQTVPIMYLGPQPVFAGLDQVNLGPLPRTLAGAGQVDVQLTVDGTPMNTVTVTFR